MMLTLLRTTLLSFAFLIPLLVVGCDEQLDNGGGGEGPPRLEIVGGDTVNWGEVGAGSLMDTLKLVNVGGDTLRITEVKPGCGCTTAPIDKDVLMSGDTATVIVTLDVAHSSGDVTKTIRISSNDSTMPDRTVTLKAHILQEISVNPAYFSVMDVKPGQSGSASVTLKNMTTAPITIQPPTELQSPLMSVKFSMTAPVELKPNDSLVVTVTATPLNAAPSTVNYEFKTSSPKTPSIKLPLSVMTVSDAPAQPDPNNGQPISTGGEIDMEAIKP
jgi:hypothetical protein